MKNFALSIQDVFSKIFIHILSNATTSHFHSEIPWPLGQFIQTGKCQNHFWLKLKLEKMWFRQILFFRWFSLDKMSPKLLDLPPVLVCNSGTCTHLKILQYSATPGTKSLLHAIVLVTYKEVINSIKYRKWYKIKLAFLKRKSML